ncbi:acetyltransferase [Legionella jordanis]|nr:acetyltransferase [Legionella jordanis]RMX15866.1 acetyltransferase [Legionella jordanis]HAT8713381.1 acetyltransferase [Legionella jordanis]
MKSLAIIGAGGHGKVVADAALCAGWSNIVFFDDAWPDVSKVGVWEVIGRSESFYLNSAHFDAVVVAIGNNEKRLSICQHLLRNNIPLATVIHPRATISRFANIGMGTVIFAGAVINPDAKVGLACIINTGATIDHDCNLGDGVHISPGAHLAGNVRIADLSWIGIGSAIRQQIEIGCAATVGAGSVVVKNVPDYSTVMGVPAEIHCKSHSAHEQMKSDFMESSIVKID